MDERIQEAFFRWVEENEEDYELGLLFESCENYVLRFQLGSSMVQINFKEKEAESRSIEKNIKKWIEDVNSSLSSSVEDFYEFFVGIFSRFAEIKDFSSDEEDEDNYHEEIHQTIMSERIKNSHVTGEKIQSSSLSFYKSHFIYKEAEEAVQLLKLTLEKTPDFNYSLNIRNNQAVCNIRLEIDLAFLEIPNSVMVMLGLNYETPLIVSCSISDLKISQTMDQQEWTPKLLGFLEFEAMQDGFCESYGCKSYIKGRVEKFRENMYKLVSSSLAIGSYTTLSRENSKDEPYSYSGKLFTSKSPGDSKDKKKKSATEISKNDETKALELLADDTFEAGAGEFSNFVIPCNNYFYNLLFYLRDRIQNCTNYCYICYKRHVADSVRLRPCSAEICEFRFEEISGISVYAEICNNPNLVQLDLSFAAQSALSSRNQTVFEPFPSFLLISKQLRGKSGFLSGQYSSEMDKNKDIKKLMDLAMHMPDILTLKTCCTDEISCRDFISSQNPFGLDVYKLVRYIIATNRMNLIQLRPEDAIPQLSQNITQYIITNHPPETIKQFAEKKAKHGSLFAFHGSSIENWYSILRNGIRNLSNTHMMTAGAALGAGVYCAENFGTSLAYSRFGTSGKLSWPYSLLTGQACMAIIEVIKTKKLVTGSGVYVVQDDKNIIIRYLLVLGTQSFNTSVGISELKLDSHYDTVTNKYLRAFQDLQRGRMEKAIKKAKQDEESERKTEEEARPGLENELKRLEEVFAGKGSTVANKRILQEYKYLKSSKECKGLTVEFDDQNIYVWNIRVDVNKFEVNAELKKDFQEYAKKYGREMEMVFEMRFDSNYPFNPPFLRIVRPRFAFHTGHVTVGGSICMQSITRSGWIPVRTVESIFIEILFNMAEGEARLDLSCSGVDYGFAEAQEAFLRVARQHNWI